MKKIKILIIMIMLFVFSSGCGKDVGSVSEVYRENESTTVETQKRVPIGETEIETESKEEEIFSIDIVDGISELKNIDEDIIYDFRAQAVKCEMSQYPETASSIETFFEKRNTEMHDVSINETEYEGYAMTYQMNIEKKRIDSSVISFLYGGVYWRGSGTEYNNRYYEGVTFDTETGMRLKLEDIVYDVEDFRKMAVSYIALLLWEEQGIPENPSMEYTYGELPEFTDEFEDYNWFFEEEGMALICNPSGKQSWTVIDRNFIIPYEKLFGYLKEEYIPSGIVASEEMDEGYVDLLDVLYVGVTTDEAASRSELDTEMMYYGGDINVYEAYGGKVEFTSFGSCPASCDVAISFPVRNVAVGGCTIGMSVDDCIENLEQYGFYVANREDDCNRCVMLHDGEWKEIDFKTLHGVVVYIRYGVYLGEWDYEASKEYVMEL